jgi:HEAT repeat protein
MNRLYFSKALIIGSLIALTLFVAATSAEAENDNNVRTRFRENAIKSIIIGIGSENAGVKKSSIYFAGRYRILETVAALIGQLKNEKEPEIRISITLSLFMIGDPEGIYAAYKIASSDRDESVRKISRIIITQCREFNLLTDISNNSTEP